MKKKKPCVFYKIDENENKKFEMNQNNHCIKYIHKNCAVEGLGWPSVFENR